MKFKYILRLCSHFLVAVIFAFVLASLFHSQFVLAELTSVGVDISMSDRLSMSLDDLIGLYPTYGIVVAISFFLGFIVAGLLLKRFNLSTYLMYGLAGGVGLSVALLAMHPILDITLLAGARSSFGFICQSFAAVMGGLVFAHLRQNHLAKQS